MTLSLDFTSARETACHCYTGVLAWVDSEDPIIVTITPEGCRRGIMEGVTTPCEDPVIDRGQAWGIAMLLTGKESASPSGDAFWNPETRRMDFQIRTTTRRAITDFDQAASDILKPNL